MMIVDGYNKEELDANIIELPSTLPVGAFHQRTLSHKSKKFEIHFEASESNSEDPIID